MRMRNKIIIGTIATTTVGAGAATAVIVVNKNDKKENKQEEKEKIIKTELTEEVANGFFARLEALKVSPGRANMLINEVNIGHLKPQELSDMIDNWGKDNVKEGTDGTN